MRSKFPFRPLLLLAASLFPHFSAAQAQPTSNSLSLWPRPALAFQLGAETDGSNAYSLPISGAPVRVGDVKIGNLEGTLQGFWGFAFQTGQSGGLPQGATITRATLEVRQGASPFQTGNLSGLGDLIVQREFLKNGVRAAALGAPDSSAGRISLPMIGNKTVDVTSIVQGFLARGEATCRFTVRFRNASNRNRSTDTLALCAGALRLSYSLPKSAARLVWSRSASQNVGLNSIYTSREDGTDLRQLSPPTEFGTSDARGPALSPDGSKIAFSFFANNEGYSIYSVKIDGSGLTRLTTPEIEDGQPCWSPNGRQIAFTRRTEGAGVWVMNADGSGAREVAHLAEETMPAWSPDGTSIAFVSQGGGNETALWVVKSDGTGLRRIYVGQIDHPVWTPGGQSLIVGLSGVLTAISLDGATARALTTPGAGYDYWPSIADDGHIVFASNRVHGGEWYNLFKCNADGSGVIQLTDSNFGDYEPSVR